MSDLIDRKAAIDVVDAVWSVTGDKNVAKVWAQIKDLPSAQPSFSRSQENDSAELCEDAVSREAMRDEIDKLIKIHFDRSIVLTKAKQALFDLPSVTPKAEQRWIPCHPSELPKDMILWVTFHDEYGCSYVETVFWDMTDWNMNVSNAVAYMPYEEPQPYKRD